MMDIVLQQRQTQSMNLVMTAELRQAIAILQYSTYELYQFIREQELENPLIQLKEKLQDSPYNRTSNGISSSADSYQNPIDFIANDDQGMHDQLLDQAKWLKVSEKDQEILRYLILNLDENAYLTLSMDEISNHLLVNKQSIKEAITLLQQLEPVGIGARDLQECLLLQVRHYYPDEELVEQVIENHLDLLANKKWNELSETMNIPMSMVKEIYDIILTLEPKPSISVSCNQAEYLDPDIIVKNKKGSYVVYLNDSYLPEIRFNNEYSGMLNGKASMQMYINNHYRKYQWLLNSIEQRRSTILKITKVIIKRQSEFFEKGFSALRPLTLKDVAEEIGMHESTVSRATTNKVIQTPKGSFDIRVFFATSISAEGGISLSQTKVKLLLEETIKSENKTKPLSDQKISDYFKTEKGITISRRTIGKYRKELNILPSGHRKAIIG